jgi:hypothetical protein
MLIGFEMLLQVSADILWLCNALPSWWLVTPFYYIPLVDLMLTFHMVLSRWITAVSFGFRWEDMMPFLFNDRFTSFGFITWDFYLFVKSIVAYAWLASFAYAKFGWAPSRQRWHQLEISLSYSLSFQRLTGATEPASAKLKSEPPSIQLAPSLFSSFPSFYSFLDIQYSSTGI